MSLEAEFNILDHETYIEEFIWIKGKDKKIVPFFLNPVQKDFMKQKTLRDIVLKARQHGFTTLILADMYCDTIFNEATKTKIVAHDKTAAMELLENLKVMYNHTPPEMRPIVGNDNKYEFEFPELNSKITIGVSTHSGTTGRSETINNLLTTEVAFWRGAADTMTGLIEAVPQNGRIVIESTPNGIGNYYHAEVLKARAGDSAFRLHEYGWWVNPEYQRPLIAGYIEAKSPEEAELALRERRLILDQEEADLQKKHGLTFEQINWRRWKIKQTPKKRKFYQENEMNFNQSGRPVFEYIHLQPYMQYGLKHRKPIMETLFESYWEAPRDSGAKYLIGVDTSEGVEGGDFSAIKVGRVCDDYKIRTVYRFRARLKPSQLAEKCDQITRFFCKEGANLVVLGIERNNHGHAVLQKVVELETPGLYYFDSGRPGWDTNGTSKPIMINEYEEAIRDGHVEEYDEITLGELEAYEWKDSSRDMAGAPEGSGSDDDFHDDTVTSSMVMYQMRKATRYHIWWPYDYDKGGPGATVIGG